MAKPKIVKDPTEEKINRLALISNNYLYYTRVYLLNFTPLAKKNMLYWADQLQAFLDENCVSKVDEPILNLK